MTDTRDETEVASGRTIQPIALPEGFDPDIHTQAFERAVSARLSERMGGTWRLTGIDVEAARAYFAPAVQVAMVSDSRVVVLPDTVKPSDGAAQASLLERMYESRYPGEGWTMIDFDPYGHRATMGRLDAEELRARDALASALSVSLRPWKVKVTRVDGGGFDVELPTTYVPSKHDRRLKEVVTTIIGHPGWWIRTDAAALTAQIRPGELPTFPPAIPYPYDAETEDIWRLPLAVRLGDPGEPNQLVELDFDATPGLLTTGTAGSGKSVFINCLIASCLARGWELAVADVPHKAVDFTWCRDLCRPGGWGCDSQEEAVTVLRLVYEEGLRRADLLKEHGVQKIQELPEPVRPRPLLVVVDEVAALFALEPVPKGIPKDHPLVTAAVSANLVTQTLINTVTRLPAEMRFTGIRVALSTQMAQANTGVSVPLKTNLANRVLLGANPNDTARGHALLDPRSVPRVPEWIRTDEDAARGVGVAEIEGERPRVIKGFYTDTEALRSWLLARGVPQNPHPEPANSDIDRLVPTLDDDEIYDPRSSRLEREGGFGDPGGDPGELKGAAKAAHDLAVSAARASLRKQRKQGD
ncbi:hypothetical protein GZ998_03490 [Actinomyces sp. 594]|uniref:FtsK/SpoIIIE domain-containing protein n=1 Tax=Actinomyces sp. 594 TaxID=2057793 RepID=UPI001C56A4D2|nr:FtsK/SpoIIIE domain-containing protein [Actinomyces sp. 594]MBW3068577.1 hypothetical protein [Actinomyces sp. 594]